MYRPLRGDLFKYVKRKNLSLDGAAGGIEPERIRGHYHLVGEEFAQQAPPLPVQDYIGPLPQDYNPHPGFMDVPAPGYDMYQPAISGTHSAMPIRGAGMPSPNLADHFGGAEPVHDIADPQPMPEPTAPDPFQQAASLEIEMAIQQQINEPFPEPEPPPMPEPEPDTATMQQELEQMLGGMMGPLGPMM